MIYRIFDLALKSTIPLPELPQENSRPAELFFRLFPRPGRCSPEPQWLHHWSLPDGKITISCGKTANHYWLRFPDLADFKLNVASGQIDGYSHADIPNSTINHLLLDQVIPRLVTHRGRPVLHASCVQIDDFAILFLGESGWGKSTLAAHFHKEGYSLLTDDCLLIERTNNQAIGTPGYSGARLWDDSLQVVANDQETSAVSNYNSKRRILFPHTPGPVPPKTPINAIFILNNPYHAAQQNTFSINKVTGAAAAIELVKHCFPLDITDKTMMAEELKTLASICGCDNLSLFHLTYERQHSLLSETSAFILKAVASAL